MTAPQITIAGRLIGPEHPPYVIAEMSNNHNNELNRALAMVDAAKEAGADAIKIQTYTEDTITLDHDGPGFVLTEGLWAGQSLYDLYRKIHMPWAWHGPLFDRARELNITLFSSPFDATAIDLLQTFDAPAYKIASFEAVDLPLIEQAAKTGKPVIVSTGVIGEEEIAEVVEAVRRSGNDQLALLHCVSAYPAAPEDFNLHTMVRMAKQFNTVTGLSDHSLGTAAAAAAVAMGACIIEKHFILSRDDGGPDAAFSLEPHELKQLVDDCAVAYLAVGKVRYNTPSNQGQYGAIKRSLYAVADIETGEIITADNVRSIRPGYGLPPKHLPEILGRSARKKITRGIPIQWDLLD